MSTKITDSKTVQETKILPETDNKDEKDKNNTVNRISADLSKNVAENIANLPMMAPDWTNRRRLIFLSMYLCGGVIGSLALVVCLAMLYSVIKEHHGTIDTNLTSLAQSFIYSLVFFGSSVVGTYCFSAAYEHMNWRNSMTNMVTKIATSAKTETNEKTDNKAKKLQYVSGTSAAKPAEQNKDQPDPDNNKE